MDANNSHCKRSKYSTDQLYNILNDSSSEDEFSESDNCLVLTDEDTDVEEENDYLGLVEALHGNADENENIQEEPNLREDSWQDDPIGMQNFDFTKSSGLLVDIPGTGLPYDFFCLVVEDIFYERIVEETNIYAETLFLSGVADNSRINQWKPLCVNELKTFFGLTLHMGTWKTNRIQDYWKTDPLFQLKCFHNNMSRDRYLLILRCLHFARNPEEGIIIEDKLYKIKPLLNYFNNIMAEVYQPGKNLSLDESMVLWRGRLSFRIYMKSKRHKYGLKLYVLAEPNGLALRMKLYTGRYDSAGGKGHSEKVVLELMRDKLNVGHSLFIDNFYGSVGLAKTLSQNNTFCTGTLISKRKDNPKKVSEAKLAQGQTIGQYKDGILVGKWRDKREVMYISTEFTNDMIETENKRKEKKIKPLPISKYNEFMSGVDRKDQMLAYYPCERKTMRWYKKIGIHIFQVLLLNSFYLYKSYTPYTGRKMNLYEYRLEIIRHLLQNPETVSVTPTNKPQHQTSDKHNISKILSVDSKGRIKRKRCKVCSKNNLRKDTIFECSLCPGKPGLCVGNCFVQFHNDQNL